MRWNFKVFGALMALGAAACADAPTQPAALVAPETRAAIRVASVLPTLPSLIAEASPRLTDPASRERLSHARNLWALADVLGDNPESRRLRDEAYAAAVPLLSVVFGAGDLGTIDRRLKEWTDLAGSVVRPGAIAGFGEALASGRQHLDLARAAAGRGDTHSALTSLLRAAERLEATTPRAVATQLTRTAEADLSAARLPRESEAQQRALRLVRGAREALDGENYELAIRRAFYASQLLRHHSAPSVAAQPDASR